MTMARKTSKRPVRATASATAKKKPRRKPVATRRGAKKPSKAASYFFPVLLSLFALGCIGFLAHAGYRTVTASEFFDVRKVDIRGTVRVPRQDIEAIVKRGTERSGTWNADLPEIRRRVEELPYVKFAAVSRVLPNGISVHIKEREPQAIVKLGNGEFYVDGEAVILGPAGEKRDGQKIILRGWSEEKSEKADKDNVRRIEIFKSMLAEWGQFDLARRVTEVDLSNMNEPRAIIEDSGSEVSVTLAKENVGKSLKMALEAVAGKGQKIKAVNAVGVYPVIQYTGF